MDISNSLNPTLASSITTDGSSYGVFLKDTLAYVANGLAGLKIIDVSNPNDPAILGQCDTPGSAAGVTAVGDYAFVADHDYTL